MGDAAQRVAPTNILKRKQMNNTSKSPISLRSAAIISGVGLLLMTVLAPIAYLNTFQNLVNFDDAALTAQNILNSMGTFRTAIVL